MRTKRKTGEVLKREVTGSGSSEPGRETWERRQMGLRDGSAGGVLESGFLATYKDRQCVLQSQSQEQEGTLDFSLAESTPGLMRDLASKNKV